MNHQHRIFFQFFNQQIIVKIEDNYLPVFRSMYRNAFGGWILDIQPLPFRKLCVQAEAKKVFLQLDDHKERL